MAFSFDSLAAWALLAAAIFSWASSRGMRSGARLNLRFAAVMLAAFAVSSWSPEPDLVFAVGWFAGALASAALALAFCPGASVSLSSFAFSGAFALGAAGALGQALAGLAVQAGAALVLLALGLARLGEKPRIGILASLGALALLFAGLALMDGEAGRASLFLAAALLLAARALQNPVIDLEPARDFLISRDRARRSHLLGIGQDLA